MKTNKNGVKLLASVAVLAMVVCAFALVLPSSDAENIPIPNDAEVLTDWNNIQADKSYKVESTVTVTDGFRVPATTTIYILNNVTVKFDGAAVKNVDGTIYALNGSTLILSSTGLVIGPTFVLVAENGSTVSAVADASGSAGNFEAPLIGTGAIVDITSGKATISGISYDMDTIASEGFSMTVDLEGVATINETSVPFVGGTTFPAFGSNTTVNVKEGSTLTIADNTTSVIGGTINNDGKIVVNKATTFSKDVVNRGLITIAAATVGTIQNQSGEISVTVDSATGMNLVVKGGEISSENGVLPLMKNGASLSMGGLTYTTYTFETANGVLINVGIPNVTYSERDYGGTTVSAIPLVASVDGTVIAIDSYAAFPGYNLIYNDEQNASENNRVFGECKDAGDDYWVSVGLSVTLSETGAAYGTIPVIFAAEFSIQKKVLDDVVIAGPDGSTDNIDPKTWDDGNLITLEYLTDYKVYSATDLRYDPEGNGDFTVGYRNNTDVSTDSSKAVIYIIWSGNYTSVSEVSKEFSIIQGLDSITVTLRDADQSHYAGQIIDKADFTVIGVYANGQTTTQLGETIDMNNVSISSVKYGENEPTPWSIGMAYLNKDTVTLVFEHTLASHSVSGSCNVSITTIQSVDATDIGTSPDTYRKEYDAGESFDPNGMKVTITYDDGVTLILQNAYEQNESDPDSGFTFVDSTATDLTTDTVSKKIDIEPKVFNKYVGDDVKVDISYFGVSKEVTVTVNGYGIIYLDTDGNEIAYQCGLVGKNAAIYNYTKDLSTGQYFLYWMVEKNEKVIYIPGTMIGYGENDDMWGKTKANTLYLQAKILDTNIATVTYPEDVTVTDKDGNEIGSSVTIGTELVITYNGGEVPAGKILTVTVNDQPIEAGEDGTYTYTVGSSKVVIEATVEAEPVTEYSEDIIVSVHYDQNKRVVVTLTAVDGKVIPAGTITVSGNYVYESIDPIDGTTSLMTGDYKVTRNIAEGENFVVLNPADDEDATFVIGMISITAAFESEEPAITKESNPMSFKYVAPATEL